MRGQGGEHGGQTGGHQGDASPGVAGSCTASSADRLYGEVYGCGDMSKTKKKKVWINNSQKNMYTWLPKPNLGILEIITHYNFLSYSKCSLTNLPRTEICSFFQLHR